MSETNYTNASGPPSPRLALLVHTYCPGAGVSRRFGLGQRTSTSTHRWQVRRGLSSSPSAAPSSKVLQFLQWYASLAHRRLHRDDCWMEPSVSAHHRHLDEWVIRSVGDEDRVAFRHWLHPFVASSPMPAQCLQTQHGDSCERRQEDPSPRGERQPSINAGSALPWTYLCPQLLVALRRSAGGRERGNGRPAHGHLLNDRKRRDHRVGDAGMVSRDRVDHFPV